MKPTVGHTDNDPLTDSVANLSRNKFSLNQGILLVFLLN